jgi:TetR/AcrR family transcriptional repressor of bet genes
MPGTKIAEEKRREQILRAAYDIASRGGLSAITIRGVALRAETSTGLVSFYFESRVGLVLALLDWILSTTAAVVAGPEIQKIPDPIERLLAVLRQEMSRLAGDRFRIRVISEFWISGIWDRPVRLRMQKELTRYRLAFLPLATAAIEAAPTRFAGVTPDALADVMVGFIKGCAIQSMIDPKMDVDEFVHVAGQLLLPSKKSRSQQTIPVGLAYGSLKLMSGRNA